MEIEKPLEGFSEAEAESIYKQVKDQIHDKHIDPDEELCFYSLVIGWAIGKGYSVDQAYTISIWIRYSTPLC